MSASDDVGTPLLAGMVEFEAGRVWLEVALAVPEDSESWVPAGRPLSDSGSGAGGPGLERFLRLPAVRYWEAGIDPSQGAGSAAGPL
jgi:hypothetical protein